MSTCRFLVLLMVMAIAAFMCVHTHPSGCQRPDSFRKVEEVTSYLDCIKTLSGTRYGKRASHNIALDNRLSQSGNNQENWQDIYDMLYQDN